MNGLNPEQNSEMIDRFIHGELDSKSENLFANNLANDESFEHEFDDMSRISEAVRSDKEAFIAPEDAKDNILGAIGLATKTGKFIAPVQFLNNAKKYWVPVAAAILVALLSTWYFNNQKAQDSYSDNNYNSKFNNNSNDVNPASNKNQSSVPIVKSNGESETFVANLHTGTIDKKQVSNVNGNNNIRGNTDKNSKSNKHAFANSDRINALSRNYSKNNNDIVANDDVANIDESDLDGGADKYANSESDEMTHSKTIVASMYENYRASYSANAKINTSGNRNRTFVPSDMSGENVFVRFARFGNKNFSVNVRGMVARNFPDNYSSTKTQGGLYNFSIGVYSNLANSENIRFGLEFGKEAFNQKFSKKATIGSVSYEQSPVIFWGAVSAHANLGSFDFAPGVSSFARLMLGSTELGPMSKIIVGFDYDIGKSGIGLMMGLEGSLMLYQNKTEWYSSQKLGFTFGASYDL